MLCYQYSQSASEVIHDTFEWLANNRRALMAVSLPILAVCLLAMYYIQVDLNMMADISSIFTVPFAQILPFSDRITTSDPKSVAFMVGAMAAVTTLMLVPLLHRYFLDRRSLYRLSARGSAVELWHNLRIAIPTALLVGLTFYLLEIGFNGFLVLILWCAVTFIVPCMIMGRWSGMQTADHLGLIMKSLLFMILVICVVKALPWLALGLLAWFIELLNDILPGLFDHEGIIIKALSVFFSALVCISLCLSVAVYLVCALLLHGAIYPVPEE